ncbi:MAG: Fis family transcriptional regulator [Burkholderiales bacterium]|jgi:Fis family transcriptional regulator|nr:Fis family transcriptional regulator [Burkholderiales bacterium]
MKEANKKAMRQIVHRHIDADFTKALDNYFTALDGETPSGLYEMVIESAERSLFQFVLKRFNGNRTLAAKVLGLSRTTFRERLNTYQLVEASPKKSQRTT